MDPLDLVVIRRRRERRRRAAQQALRVRYRNLRDNANPWELPENNFCGKYRLSRDLAWALVNELRPFMPLGQIATYIPVELRVLMSLHFFAQGSYQKSVGSDNEATMSQSAVSVSLTTVVRALNHPQVLTRHIRFPQTAFERRRVMERNYHRYPYIPGVVGSVDGVLIPIIAPNNHEELYVCRKNFHCLNVQICADVDYIILNIVARYPGSSHDSFVWANSALRQKMESLFRAGEPCWLLGDSGYSLEPWLMTPIEGAHEGSPEANYTMGHMITRSSVERTIGHLRARFRCLNKHRVLHYEPQKAGRIINACAVLHNMCLRAHLPDPSDSSSSDEDEVVAEEVVQVPLAPRIPEGRLRQEALTVRQRLVQRATRVPHAVRPQIRRHHRRGEIPVRPQGPLP